MIRVRLAGGPGLVLLDALVVVWVLAWLAAGVLVSREVRGLSELSDTAAQTGQAAMAVGDAVRELPLVGDRVRTAADEVREAGADAVGSADAARRSARRVGDLLGVAIAAIPSLPVLLLYLPARIAATRERRELQDAMRSGSPEELDRLLAVRAAASMPLRRLREVTDDPARDLAEGRHDALAGAELERFGIERRPAEAADRR